jgi:rubredoxin
MKYKRLTKISEITNSPTLKAMCESCGESGCNDFCEDFQDHNCIGCPVQSGFQMLSDYEDSGLSPEQVKDALEKQIPLKVFTEYDNEFTCPVCEITTEDYNVKTLKFCPECGQKLHWD